MTMARSPFQGTYQPGVRPTVITAPDALVYINGETDILGCSKCRRRFNWNRYITSIQVDLNVDSSPGSASINLSLPRHSVDEFYFDGNPLITEMMEVEIFAKGFYLLEGVPQYYPIFWGLVTEVSDSYSGGEHTFSINCADILKWWELCKMNVTPAFTEPTGQGGRSIFGNVFFGMNPYDVIWTLAQQSFGDVVVGTGSLNMQLREKNPDFKSTFSTALGDIMQYWNKRFSKIRSNLMLYGTSGTAVRGDTIQAAYQNRKPQFGKPFVSQLVRQANGGTAQMDFDPTDPDVVAFRTQGGQAGQVNFWQTEYQTKLELANAAKEAIGFEFYMDVTGDLVFKPPFYNLDILSNKPVSWIQDIDIIDWDFSQSEAEVVTQVQLQGNFTGSIDWGMPEEATPLTSVTDYHLLRKYGWRSQTFNSEFLADPKVMFYVGLDMLDRYNCKRFRGTVTIPFRPELRLGFPIYVGPKDQVWYIQGISHNISFGGRAQTTLSLTAKRSKFLAPRGIGTLTLTSYKGAKETSDKKPFDGTTLNLTPRQLADGGRFKADVGEAAQIPPVNSPDTTGGIDPYEPLLLRHPKTGRIVGYPNVVMAYTSPFSATPDQLAKLQGRKKGSDPRVAQSKIKKAETASKSELADVARVSSTVTPSDEVREKHLNNRYTYGINSAGVYTYLHDQSKVVKEMLLIPASNITFNQEVVKFYGQSGMIRPVSDERGFEVIGHHRYGRGVSLRDGALVLTEGPNGQVAIGTQLALAGGLIETLQAQSAGLTTVSTSYANPADAIARLQPDDLQTAAAINPETKKPELVTSGTTFITNASVNSKQVQGGVSPPDVEANQLSKALSLAEMSVRSDMLSSGDTVDPNCDCVSGRSDLAFINVGYQVQTLNPTQSDISLHAEAKLIVDAAAAQATKDLAARSASNATAGLAEVADTATSYQEFYNQALQTALNGATPELTQAVNDVNNANISEDLTARPSPVVPGQVLTKVDNFLASLYKALDGPHQRYEQEIRGDLLTTETRTPAQIRFENAPSDVSPFAPPYSTPNRAAGGDPTALALQAKTSLNRVSDAWSGFGNKLKAESERKQLQSQINTSKAHITALEAEKRRLQTIAASGGVVVGSGESVSQQIAQIDKDITAETQSVSSNTTKLGQLSQEFPP